jgi:hypothetical protein
MTRPIDSLLADVVAEVGNREPSAYPHKLCDEILNRAWELEHHMFSPCDDLRVIYSKARDVAVSAIRIMREMDEMEDDNGC